MHTRRNLGGPFGALWATTCRSYPPSPQALPRHPTAVRSGRLAHGVKCRQAGLSAHHDGGRGARKAPPARGRGTNGRGCASEAQRGAAGPDGHHDGAVEGCLCEYRAGLMAGWSRAMHQMLQSGK